jgi:hypothetical protein
MKQRVLGKTTQFHALKKEEEKRNNVVLDGTVPPFSSPGHATGEEKFLFFSVCFFLSLPPSHVLC